MVGDVLGRFQGAVVVEVGGDAGGPEGVVADEGLDAGGGEVGSYSGLTGLAFPLLKAPGCVQAHVSDVGLRELVGRFELLSIEDHDIFECEAVGETNVNALVAHAGFGEFQ